MGTRRLRRGPDPTSLGGPRSAAAAGRAGATEQPKWKPREARDWGRGDSKCGAREGSSLDRSGAAWGAASPRGSSGGRVPRIQRKWDGDAGRPSPRQLGAGDFVRLLPWG